MTVTVSANAKVNDDLSSLEERIDLADMMRKETTQQDEVLLAVIGFLEACKPRVDQLIQAGTEGALSEEVFMKTLNVNDKLLAILADEPLPVSPDVPAAPASEEPQKAPPSDPTATDLLLSDTSVVSKPPAFDLAAAAAASDPFAGSDSLLEPEKKPAPAPPLRAPSGSVGKMPPPSEPPLRSPSGGGDIFDTLPPPPPVNNLNIGKTKSEDLFDDFVGLRKNSGDGK
ncbi:hypothetical protein TrCOL_g3176 [Triparma columacea]|uniref:GAT domain-containing protein n=1 Tax=Triparma columacea TaxID=722753 RepID=A0A9W7L385_9STRA|nr:hypothetical protein TrCOL_g3176 [Triparma columacea]